MAFSDDSWKTQRLSISLKGDWHFATDPGDQGMKEQWFAENFDDSSWKILKSGLSWQEQGVTHHGFGWYRQKILVPKECAGTPLTITLAKIPSDDDAWFNGVRIGGWSGEYKYDNRMTRVYTVPPSLIHYGETNEHRHPHLGRQPHVHRRQERPDRRAARCGAGSLRRAKCASPPAAEEVAAEIFDLSDARQGKPFEIVFPFPPEIAKEAGRAARLPARRYERGRDQIGQGRRWLRAADQIG